jgi:hypothetical protein
MEVLIGGMEKALKDLIGYIYFVKAIPRVTETTGICGMKE